MFIISAGMPKSGSAYFYNLINDLIVEAGHSDARKIKEKFKLQEFMKWHNNQIGVLTILKLLKLWFLSIKEGAFVVKTHGGPIPVLKLFCLLGQIKIVYCYRDPRDVLLSAIDHGKRILSEGGNHTFAKMIKFEDALCAVKSYIKIWRQYKEMKNILMLKYEDVMESDIKTMKCIVEFLGLSVSDDKIQSILWKYDRRNPHGDRRGLHFNNPGIFRYKTEMSYTQRLLTTQVFRETLVRMGYEVLCDTSV
jgi:hypothetical protein